MNHLKSSNFLINKMVRLPKLLNNKKKFYRGIKVTGENLNYD